MYIHSIVVISTRAAEDPGKGLVLLPLTRPYPVTPQFQKYILPTF